MNKVILMGRVTKDPDVKYSQGSTPLAVARFSLAVDRKFKKEGDAAADFIPCITFGKTAEFVEKHVIKGTKLAVTGRIQTGSYTNKDGQKVYTTDVMVEELEFAESKKTAESNGHNTNNTQKSAGNTDGFMNIPDGIDEQLPFN